MNEMVWKDKVAVVTGAGGTLCSEIAKFLAAQGAKVVMIGRTAEKLQTVADVITANGGICRIEAGDVTDEKRMQEIADTVAAEWGLCRILINGAGGNNINAMSTITQFDPRELDGTLPEGERGFADIDMEAFASVLKINTIGTVLPSRIFGAQMAKAGSGSIINFASGAGLFGNFGQCSYAAAKEGIRGLSRVAATEWAKDGINTNVICPLAWTAQLENFQKAYPEAFKENVTMPPAGHYGDSELEIGRVCVQLANPDFKYMNGETLTLEGGMGLRP